MSTCYQCTKRTALKLTTRGHIFTIDSLNIDNAELELIGARESA